MNALKRRLCSALLLCALVLSLSSCFIIINHPEDTDAATEATDASTAAQTTAKPPVDEEGITSEERAKRRLDSLIDFDMDGATIIFATADTNVPMPISGSRHIDKARWSVLEDVKEKYGIELIVTRESAVYMQSKLLEARNSGLYYADIVSLRSGDIGSYFVEGLLADLSDLPFMSLGSEYYYGMATESASAGGRTFATASEACVDFDAFRCMLVNLNAAEKCGFGDIYDVVENGSWTYDKLLEYIKLYEYSEDGSFVGTALSSAFDIAESQQALFEATGTRYVYPEGEELKLYSPVGAAQKAVSVFRELFYQGNFGFEMNEADKQRYWDVELNELVDPGQLQLFSDGKGVFYLGTLNDLSRVFVSDDMIVPLPLPKLDAEQEEYVTSTGGDATFFAIPADSANITESAIIIEALSARAYGAIADAYVTNSLHYYIRQERSIDILKGIISRPYFDLAVNFGSQYGALAQDTGKTLVMAAETGLDVLDVHYWYYFAALDALYEIEYTAKEN